MRLGEGRRNLHCIDKEAWAVVSLSSDYEVSTLGRVRLRGTNEISAQNGAAVLVVWIGTSWSVRAVSNMVAETYLGPARLAVWCAIGTRIGRIVH